MKLVLVLLGAAAAVWGQTSGEANEHYRTREQRERLARALADPARDARQKPRELVAGLHIAPGSRVADIGCGPGYMEPYLAAAAGPKGRVIAEDVRQDFLDVARASASLRRLNNVEFVLGEAKDPHLARGSADLIFMLETYHHFDDPAAVLAAVRKALAPNGRLAIVDFYKRPGAIPGMDAMKHIRLDRDAVVREVEVAGFQLTELRDHIPGSQYVVIFVAR